MSVSGGLVRRVGLLLSLAVIFVIGPVAQTDAADSDNASREPVATYRPLLDQIERRPTAAEYSGEVNNTAPAQPASASSSARPTRSA